MLNKPGWKQFKHYVANKKRYIMAIKQAHKIKANAVQIKFGIEIPRGFEDALRLDKQNGNELWKKTIETELAQIMDYKTFTDNGDTIPQGHKQIPVNFV